MKVCSACADVWRMLKYVDVCWRMQACRVLTNMTACSNRTLWEISMRLVFTCVSTYTHTHQPHTYSWRLYLFVWTYMHGCKLCVLLVCVRLYLCFCLRDWLLKMKNIYVRAHAKSTHTKPILTNAPSCYWDWGRICFGKLSTHASLRTHILWYWGHIFLPNYLITTKITTEVLTIFEFSQVVTTTSGESGGWTR